MHAIILKSATPPRQPAACEEQAQRRPRTLVEVTQHSDTMVNAASWADEDAARWVSRHPPLDGEAEGSSNSSTSSGELARYEAEEDADVSLQAIRRRFCGFSSSFSFEGWPVRADRGDGRGASLLTFNTLFCSR